MITVYYLTDAEIAARRQDTSLPESERHRICKVKPGTVLTETERNRILGFSEWDSKRMRKLADKLDRKGKSRVACWVKHVTWKPVIVRHGKEA